DKGPCLETDFLPCKLRKRSLSSLIIRSNLMRTAWKSRSIIRPIQPHRKMNLSRDFFEPQARVKLLPDGILIEGFNLGDLHALLAEKTKRMFEQRAANALTLVGGIDGEVGDPADSAFGVESRGDVADDVALASLCNENTVR